MTKIEMREWVASLEEMIDNKLKKWRKTPKVENGESVQLRWTWEQTHIQLNIFWENHQEAVHMMYLGPRMTHSYHWNGLNDKTFNMVTDRVGNLSVIAMHPIIDPAVD